MKIHIPIVKSNWELADSEVLNYIHHRSIHSKNHTQIMDDEKGLYKLVPPIKRLRLMNLSDLQTPVPEPPDTTHLWNEWTPPRNKSAARSLHESLHLTTPNAISTPYLNRSITKSYSRHRSSRSENKTLVPAVNPYTSDGVSKHINYLNEKKIFENAINGNNGSYNCTKDVSNAEFVWGTPLKYLEISRYHEEFQILDFIDEGKFGEVVRCRNYLDGIVYAIKISKKNIIGEGKSIRLEAFALSALKSHSHIVKYYSSWVEDEKMFIQMEYCDRGNLESFRRTRTFTERGILRIAKHIARGLRYIHSQDLVHMDVKTSNILVCSCDVPISSDDEVEEDDKDDMDVIYKIGDLGHMISVRNVSMIEDGDSRYMAKEILKHQYEHLPKADIFSLGLILYEIASGTESPPLPKNGYDWHMLRDGYSPFLNTLSKASNYLIKTMLHNVPEKRFSAKEVIRFAKNRLALTLKGEQISNNNNIDHNLNNVEFESGYESSVL